MIRHDKIYTPLVAMLWLTLGCTADHSDVTPQHDSPELHFTAATVAGATTRADAGDAYNDALPSGSNIGVYIYGYEGTTGYDISADPVIKNAASKTWVYTTVGSAYSVTEASETFKVSNLVLTSHTKAPKFPGKVSTSGGDMDNVKIFAVYPNNTAFKPSGNKGTDNNDIDYYDFTAEINQTTANAIMGSDLMASDLATYTKAETEHVNLRLNLKHRMAKVHVTFVSKAGSDLTSANMPLTYDVIGVYRSLRINPKAGTVTPITTGANGVKTTEADPLQASVDHSFFIAPQEFPAGTLLKFNIRGSGNFRGIEGLTFATSSTVSFEAGKSYEVTVTIDVDHATTTGTISAWENGGLVTISSNSTITGNKEDFDDTNNPYVL